MQNQTIERIKLYDTLSRSERELAPEDGQTFRFYCCGPTVYGPAHIGNFRTFVVQDLFRRTLELTGAATRHVRNLTDVDDKTIRQSQVEGKSLGEFTRYWTQRFHADCERLGMLSPAVEPGAVDHIPQQISLIEQLIERGHAYRSEDGSVYFSVDSFPEYGKLAHLDRENLKAGAGQAQLSDEYEKESLADFALWKAWKPEDGENYWESPWGRGRPGWHIECSAMSMEYLGTTLDLHSGGVDLIFPHHENEIAQSEGATGKTFARHWFHVTHLLVDGGKMSKSKGNLFTVSDLEERGYTPEELRYVLLMGYYRQQLNFTFDSLRTARVVLKRIAKAVQKITKLHPEASIPSYQELCELAAKGEIQGGLFLPAWQALLHDLNTPDTLGKFYSALKVWESRPDEDPDFAQSWLGFWRVVHAFGWQLPKVEEQESVQAPEEVQQLAQLRWEAKQSRNFAESDRLRQEILDQGWEVKDRRDGYDLISKSH